MNNPDDLEIVAAERNKYRADGPDIFPHLENNMAGNMRRIAVACYAGQIASDLWSWGAGATENRTLEGAMMYHLRPSPCIPHETYQEALDFVASWVPNGRRADMDALSTDEIRALMEPCIAAAKAHGQRYRNRI